MEMQYLLVLIVIGIVCGWLAGQIVKGYGFGLLGNIVVGIVGALIAGVLVTPLIGGLPITSGSFDILSVFSSFLGAVILLAVVNLFRRGSVR